MFASAHDASCVGVRHSQSEASQRYASLMVAQLLSWPLGMIGTTGADVMRMPLFSNADAIRATSLPCHVRRSTMSLCRYSQLVSRSRLITSTQSSAATEINRLFSGISGFRDKRANRVKNGALICPAIGDSDCRPRRRPRRAPRASGGRSSLYHRSASSPASSGAAPLPCRCPDYRPSRPACPW